MVVGIGKRTLFIKVSAALREGNIDPDRVARIPLFGVMLGKVRRGEQSINWLVTNCRKIVAVNKKVREECEISRKFSEEL